MAKNRGQLIPPLSDLTNWWSDISYFPPDLKNQLWCAQMLFYMKKNSVLFLDPKRAKEYRKIDRLEVNKQDYINMIDPRTPQGNGGKAEYFNADFQANPIYMHLLNIVKAKLEKLQVVPEVNVIDKVAKLQKQREKDRIIHQNLVRDIINETNKQIGLPPISESQDPYKWIESITKGEKGDEVISTIDNALDYIKTQIRDSQDLTLYEEYIYKGDIEKAFELGIQHYLINQNKWHIKSELFNNDLLHFNKFSGRWYIDETTGRGTVEYIDPDRLYTSPFMQKNGEDIVFWFNEYDVTFADFVRMFGLNLTEEQLKEVFDLNKTQGAQHGMDWKGAKSIKGSNAKIRIGYASALTQDFEVFAEKYATNKIPTFLPKKLSWMPDKHTPSQYQSQKREKHYNVWYSWYYIPPPSDRLSRSTEADFAWQSQYVFNIKKDMDQYRYGVDLRYAKSTLVIWKDERASFTDIMQAFMPKINNTWHKFQNCLIQDTSALAIDEGLITGLLGAVDEANKDGRGNGYNAAIEAMKSLKQSGMAFVKFRDKNGVPLQNTKDLFVPINTGHLEKAERYLALILQQYNMMTIALAQNDLAEGQDPTPRTPVAAVKASLAAVSNGIWFIEKPVRECLIMFCERVVHHITMMAQENKKYGYKERWEEFKNVIGLSNALILEGIEDIPLENIGLTVTLEDPSANQQYVFELANKMADNGEIARDALGIIIELSKSNYKYAWVMLMVSAKKQARERAEQEDLAHQRQLELQQQQLQIAQALQQNKDQGKMQQQQLQGQIEGQLQQQMIADKTKSQAVKQEQTKNNRIEQDNNKSRLEREKEQQEKADMPALT